MRKAVLVPVLCLSLTVGVFALDLSVKVTGGMSLLFGGDYNAAVQGRNDYYHDIAPSFGGTVNSQLSKLSLGLDFGAEFLLQFTPSVGLGLGVGYFHASNDSTAKVTWTSGGITRSGSWEYAPNIPTIPLTLNFHYFLPLGSRAKLHLFAGPGLYIVSSPDCKVVYIETLDVFETMRQTTTFTANTKAIFGFQGGLGFEFDLSPRVGLLLDVAGRYLNLSNITGSIVQTGHSFLVPISYSGKGTLYYYEFEYNGNSYGNLYPSPILPSGFGFLNVREASVSLSGVQFQLGFIFHF